MKWIIGLFVIGAIFSCIKIIFRKIVGVALLLGLGFALIGWITDLKIFFSLMEVCVSIGIIVFIGALIKAIFED